MVTTFGILLIFYLWTKTFSDIDCSQWGYSHWTCTMMGEAFGCAWKDGECVAASCCAFPDCIVGPIYNTKKCPDETEETEATTAEEEEKKVQQKKKKFPAYLIAIIASTSSLFLLLLLLSAVYRKKHKVANIISPSIELFPVNELEEWCGNEPTPSIHVFSPPPQTYQE